jgi:hypothetical protein
MRLAAWQVRRARDDLARAFSELPEIDGCDLAAFVKEGGDDVLVVRAFPSLSACSPREHLIVPPSVCYLTKLGSERFRIERTIP